MDKLIVNRRIILSIIILFSFVFAVQMADPASAAKWKMIKSGHTHFTDFDGFIDYWKVYKKGNKQLMVKENTVYGDGAPGYTTYLLKKITKKKLVIYQIRKSSTYKYVHKKTFKTSLSPYGFFKKYYNKGKHLAFSSVWKQ